MMGSITKVVCHGVVLAMVTVVTAPLAWAGEGDVGQVFFRGSATFLSDDRGGEVFTDTASGLGAGPSNDGDSGWAAGAGLALKLMDGDEMPMDAGDTCVLGEIFVEYATHSNERVVQTASALLGAPVERKIDVSSLAVSVAPKVQFNSSGTLRPWIIPVGMAFLVNSPPSDNATYLDLGLHFGGGLEVALTKAFSLGADVRYNYGFERSDTNTSYLSAGGYLGINF